MSGGYLKTKMICARHTIFFSNPKVSSAALLEPHYLKTVERVAACDCKYILAIQDDTLLNYTSHKAKTEIGRIGKTKNTEQYGLVQHSTLLVTDKNEPLGLIDLQHFHNDDLDPDTEKRRNGNIEDKRSWCWIEALMNTSQKLKGQNKKIITVADRESDIFEFMHELGTQNHSFVIRAKHNRYTGETYRKRLDRLFDLIEKQTVFGEMRVTINDATTHKIKEINLKLKVLERIEIPRPEDSKSRKNNADYHPVFINVIKAYDDIHSWTLLTDLPVNTFEACREIIDIYKSRWHIEDYHKILKTGYQIDELYLHSSRQAIENALVMASISAVRLYWMIYVGRVEKDLKANQIFEEYEWKAVYVYFKEKIPAEAPPLAEIIIKIARMGGYKVNKHAEQPGIKTMWLGFQAFGIAAEMLKNFMSTKT